MKIDLVNTVFVFDLDDTLYKEADYHASGVLAVSSKVNSVYGLDADAYLQEQVALGQADLWGSLCSYFNLPSSVKESLVWEYRLHVPKIKLGDDVLKLINWLKQESAGVAVLTDGRSVTQRLKINALGLSNLPAFISDEHGAMKPDPLRFKLIEKEFPDKNYIYIGDNPAKDFLAPNSLDWKTIGLKGDQRNIHSQDVTTLDKSYLPDCWLSELKELKGFIC